MNYRSYGDLSNCIIGNMHKVPPKVDLIVGIPTSGMLAASILALALNRSLTDIDGFLEGRLYSGGVTRAHSRLNAFPASVQECELALVVDDSIASGRTMKEVRRRVEELALGDKVMYCAVFATRKGASLVDIHFDICPNPSLFEWNFMHHRVLANCCVDMDGVICHDPVWDDDGPAYLRFIQDATPLYIPTVSVGSIVSARLEKYRKPTEDWLCKHDVRYKELLLLDLPDAQARRTMRNNAAFKAQVYRNKRDAVLFIESEAGQAAEIARLSGKPVLSVEDGKMAEPGWWSPGAAKRNGRGVMRKLLGRAARAALPADVVSKLRRSMFSIL